jgi:V8-like Glu-specific endopeptidase
MAEVKRDGTALWGRGAGLPPPVGAAAPSSEWFRRLEGQLEQTERRYRERRRVREGVVHQLQDEGRTPLDVDTPERVRARLTRLGIESADGTLCPDIARARSSITAEPVSLVYERVLGHSDLTSVCFLERGLQVSRTVGRVRIRDSRGRPMGYGTGFLVSPRLLLTNNHVLRSATEAGNSQIEFNYQSGVDGASLPSVLFALDPGTFFVTNARLDYTLVAVKPRSLEGQELQDFGFNRLIEAQGKVLLGEYVNIIQHPNGEPKQLALRENQVVDLLEDFCHYQTDTAPGSSGSPVYNDQWEVVALHHMGVPKRSEDGRLLTASGETWEQGMDPALLAWKANEGVRVSSLVRHLRARSLSGEAARLRAEVLEAVGSSEKASRPRTGSRRRPAQISARRSTQNDRESSSVETAGRGSREPVALVVDSTVVTWEPEPSPGQVALTEGGATLTLPLRLNIQLRLG